jgi:hypothetical protein
MHAILVCPKYWPKVAPCYANLKLIGAIMQNSNAMKLEQEVKTIWNVKQAESNPFLSIPCYPSSFPNSIVQLDEDGLGNCCSIVSLLSSG